MMHTKHEKMAHRPHYAYPGMQMEEAGKGLNLAAFGILISLTGIVGFWGLACMMAALINHGLLGLGRMLLTVAFGL